MPEWLVALLMIFMWIFGFTSACSFYLDTPFWKGWRRGVTLGLWRD